MDTGYIAHVAANPDYLDRLSHDDLLDVLADLEWLRARVWIRVVGLSEDDGDEEASTEPERDQMLNVDEAAGILGVSPRWLYDRSDELPFARKLAPQTLRFSERGLYRWLEAR